MNIHGLNYIVLEPFVDELCGFCIFCKYCNNTALIKSVSVKVLVQTRKNEKSSQLFGLYLYLHPIKLLHMILNMVDPKIIVIGNETIYETLNSRHTFVVKYNMENYTSLDIRVDDSEIFQFNTAESAICRYLFITSTRNVRKRCRE